MKLRSFQALLAGAFALVATALQAQQTPVTYADGDLFLGVRATAEPGSQESYLVNIGQASIYRDATSEITVSTIGNIKADLDNKYGNNWLSRADVLWSVVGTSGRFQNGIDPAKTIYATKPQASPGTPNPANTRWVRLLSSAQGTVSGDIETMISFYLSLNSQTPNLSTANSTKAIFQDANGENSYPAFMPGGRKSTVGTSFSQYSPTIEDSFNGGISQAVNEFYRIVPRAGGGAIPSEFIGTFSFNASGQLVYTPFNDPTIANIVVTAETVSVNDTAGTVTISLTRTGNTTSAVTANISTADGTAVAGTDYTLQGNTPVQFAANATTATVDIPILNAGFRGARTFTVSLVNVGAGASIKSPATTTVTINETATVGLAFAQTQYSFAEDAPNGAEVVVTRLGSATGAYTVQLSTADGSAVAGQDYTQQSNVTVSFADNETSKVVNIPLIPRSGDQGARTFTATLSSPSAGADAGPPATTTITITDGGVPGQLGFQTATSTAEPYNNQHQPNLITIPLTRTNGSDDEVTVSVAAGAGTLGSPADFTFPDGNTVTFGDGETTGTVSVQLVAPLKAGTIVLQLSNPTNGASLGAITEHTITINSPDVSVPTLVVASPKAGKLGTATTFTVSGSAADDRGIDRIEVRINGEVTNVTPGAVANNQYPFSLPNVPADNGSNVVEITAVDFSGNRSKTTTRVLTFVNNRPGLAGNYNGLISNQNGTIFDSNGLISVKVAASGTFTGKVSIGGLVLPISGVFRNDGSAAFGKTAAPTFELLRKAGNVSLGHLALTLSTNDTDYEVSGTIKNGTAPGAVVLADVEADLAVYTSKKNPAAPFRAVPATLYDATQEKGKYTALFPPSAVGDTLPSGFGYGTITLSLAGTVKIVGKLADGSKISYTNALSKDNRWPMYISLYGKKGFIAGEITFDSTQATSDAAGATLWYKPAGVPKQTYFPGGWPIGLTPSFIASKYLVPTVATTKNPNPANPNTVLGKDTPAGTPIELDLENGGITGTLNADGTIDAKSKVTLTNATANQKVALTAKTGALSGSFTHPVSNKTVKFAGVAFQKTSLAAGFFQLPAVSGAPAKTGSVQLYED